MPTILRSHFPECLVLGPEQLEAIRFKGNRILLIGEVGCGKSLVLLALLYKYTAKCLSLLESPKYFNVVFVIPEQKTEFRIYVEKFIQEHCNSRYIRIESSIWRVQNYRDVDLILIDELYSCIADFDSLSSIKISRKIKICAAVVTMYFDMAQPLVKPTFYNEWTLFYLRNSYRSPVNISLRCAKVRRTCMPWNPHYSDQSFDLTLAMTLNNGTNVNDDRSVQVYKYGSEIDFPPKIFPNETRLLVAFGLDTKMQQCLCDVQTDFSAVETIKYHRTAKATLEGDLTFTGSEYQTVIIILGRLPPNFDKEFLGIVLYHTISRSLDRLFILCHEADEDFMSKLMKLDTIDFCVFQKLQKKQDVAVDDFELVRSEEEKKDVLRILLLTRNHGQFSKMLHVFEASPDISAFVENKLMRYFPLGEKGEIMLMLRDFMKNRRSISQEEFILSFINSAEFLTTLDQLSVRRNILRDFKKLLAKNIDQLDFDIGKVDICRVARACIIWGDEEIFLHAAVVVKNFVASVSSQLIQLADEALPGHLKPLFSQLLQGEEAGLEEIRELFQKYSVTGKGDKLMFEWSEMTDMFLHFCTIDFLRGTSLCLESEPIFLLLQAELKQLILGNRERIKVPPAVIVPSMGPRDFEIWHNLDQHFSVWHSVDSTSEAVRAIDGLLKAANCTIETHNEIQRLPQSSERNPLKVVLYYTIYSVIFFWSTLFLRKLFRFPKK